MREISFKKENETEKHAAAISRIAASTELSREEIQLIYERELSEIQRDAKITTFLAIFAARRVEQFLKRSNAPGS